MSAPIGYDYKGRLKNPGYFWKLAEKRLGAPIIGIRETPNEFTIYFDTELPPDKKRALDELVRQNPEPEAILEIGDMDLEEEIQKAIGIRPVRAEYNPMTGRGVVEFDVKITEKHEAVIKGILQDLHNKKRIRRIK